MAKVIKGTRQGKQVNINKTMHEAGVNKIRCVGCKIGMAVAMQDSTGATVMRCNRCGRTYAAPQAI